MNQMKYTRISYIIVDKHRVARMRILSKWLFGENGFVGRFRKAIDLGDHYLPKILNKECCRLTVQRSLL